MIARYLEALPDEALRRVAKAEQWKTLPAVLRDGSRCLLGHAENWTTTDYLGDRAAKRVRLFFLHVAMGGRFDRLCDRFTLPRVVSAIRQRANRILAERAAEKDLESVGAHGGFIKSPAVRSLPVSAPALQ